VCTYQTETLEVTGSAKGPEGWFRVSEAVVYLDHPQHALAEHTLNVDFRNPALGPATRSAVELDPAAALRLARAIVDALRAAPPGLLPGVDPDELARLGVAVSA
jgi:hypothetical protein